jgi:prevent-host-death family protein
MRQWALQDAKARLSEVVRLATEHEPQEITLRGEPAVVVLAREDYDRLTTPRESLVEFMRRSPLYGAEDIEFPRDQSLTREVEL